VRARGKVTLFRGEMKDRVHSRHRQSRVNAFGYNILTIPEGTVIGKTMVTQQRRNGPPFVKGIGTTMLRTGLSCFLHNSSMACEASRRLAIPQVQDQDPSILFTNR
jgi:hypothetical protein